MKSVHSKTALAKTASVVRAIVAFSVLIVRRLMNLPVALTEVIEKLASAK